MFGIGLTLAVVVIAAAGLRKWVLSRERPAIEGGKMDVAREEPLARELADFVRAAQARSQPLVDGAAGRRALALAVQVAQAMDIG